MEQPRLSTCPLTFGDRGVTPMYFQYLPRLPDPDRNVDERHVTVVVWTVTVIKKVY